MDIGLGFARSTLGPVIASPIRAMFNADRFPQEQYREPAGDPGLFGPQSVTWRVHADPALLVGGLSALMLQALHPLAMAGVAEHSRYRDEPFKRLSRTASFVTATTYGSTDVAESILATVHKMHRKVKGTAPDGRAYSAGDPELLTWIHMAEMSSFLYSHRRYNLRPIRGAQIDQYYDEVSVIAERLGATSVPKSRDEATAYFRRLRPELTADDQARTTLRFILESPDRNPAFQVPYQVLVRGAIGLLPGWARDMYGIRSFGPAEQATIRPAVAAILGTLKLAMGPPLAIQEAMERCAA